LKSPVPITLAPLTEQLPASTSLPLQGEPSLFTAWPKVKSVVEPLPSLPMIIPFGNTVQDWNSGGQMPDGKLEPGKKPIAAKSNWSNPKDPVPGDGWGRASLPQATLFGCLFTQAA
jgi:hypothetical protein